MTSNYCLIDGKMMEDNGSKLRKIRHIILHSANSPITDSSTPQSGADVVVKQANTDEQAIALWLHGRSPHTQKAYSGDVIRVFSYIQKPLRLITLGDLQRFADSLIEEGLKPSSQNRILASIKSLISFAHKIGYLQFNVAKALKVPKYRECLSERILTEAEIQRVIGMENNPRNRLILRVLYAGGIRVSELCRLTWKDMQSRNIGGQMTVYGKGSKTNTIIIPNPLWEDLVVFRGEVSDDNPVFRSRKEGLLSPSQVWRIVKKSAKKAGIKKPVSPHWLRHAHASHALDHGAQISLVQKTLSHSSIQTTGKYIHARPNESSSMYLEV